MNRVKLVDQAIQDSYTLIHGFNIKMNTKRKRNPNFYDDYHLFYNSKSLISTIKVNYITIKLILKQLLRDRGIIGGIFQLDSLFYYTKMKKLKNYDWKNG